MLQNEQNAGNKPGTPIERPGDSSRGGRKWLLEGARWLLPPGTEDVTDRNGLGHDKVFGHPRTGKSQDASGGHSGRSKAE